MTDHQREVLQALKSELWFLEMRGYEPSVREARKELSIFRDSPSCLNYALFVKEHSCAECWLMDFVPVEKWGEEIPCQHIPLNPAGDTIAAMAECGDTLGAQEAQRDWLRRKIKEMETAPDAWKTGGESTRENSASTKGCGDKMQTFRGCLPAVSFTIRG